MTNVIMSETGDYETLTAFFIENELEYSEEEPVPTDLVKCWKLTRGKDGPMVGAVELALREGQYIIDGIAVSEAYRKAKLGGILLEKAVAHVRSLGGKQLFLVARAPGFFKKQGFMTIPREEAPNFFECFTCPQYGHGCSPEVMRLDLQE